MQDPQPTPAQVVDIINAFTAYLEIIERNPDRQHMKALTNRITFLTSKVDSLERELNSLIDFMHYVGITPQTSVTPAQMSEIKGAIEAILND